MTDTNPTDPTDAQRQYAANRLHVVNLYLGGFLYFLGMTLIIVTWAIAGGPFFYAIGGLVACAFGTFFAAPGARIVFGKKTTEQTP